MNFKKALKDGVYSLDLRSESKDGIIEELLDMLVAAGRVTDKQAALDAVMARERKMSTGMQYGIAIPHGKTTAVNGLVTAIGLKKEGAEFDALDGQPSRIFIMTLSPVNHSGPHIQYLSEISRLLGNAAVRERLLNARNVPEIVGILSQ